MKLREFLDTAAGQNFQGQQRMFFVVILPRPMLIAGSRGGHRSQFTYAAVDTADALRLYWQEFPEGLEPETVMEV